MAENKKTGLMDIFLIFLKIGAFTFGGGYAMIALLEDEFVDKRSWLNESEFLDMTAIAESTPGPVAINAATYLGYKLAGFKGALAASLAVCIPSFAIIYVISFFYERFQQITWVASAFKGIQACVVYLILSAGLRMFIKMKKNVFNVSIFAVVSVSFIFVSLFGISFSSIYYILICGVVGVVVGTLHNMRNREDGGAA
ncbi:chromate transporter [Coprococcus sp. OM04-5BH]|uniref:chromate transporter n=1 Tax=Coprococcus sp. OM04-5BH TaxID=2293093 RepID=UPI0026B9155A|nr:chromate transporter [Coprococcus sp. OM04-5BH]